MNRIVVTLIVGAVVLIAACSKDDIDNGMPVDPFSELNLPEQYFNYANIGLPDFYTTSGFPAQFQFQAPIAYDNTPADNQITDAGATLGRVLFYDKKLSANSTISCASCLAPGGKTASTYNLPMASPT